MAADCKDVNLELPAVSRESADNAAHLESGTQQESLPYAPVQVSTVSDKVPEGEAVEGKRARVPRRILHFSDGTLEEYSTEEEEDEVDSTDLALQELRTTDVKSLGWMSWGWYWFRLAGYNTLSRVDMVGEKLAWVLGITSPKYQYELDEYYEMQRKEKEEKEQKDLEAAGWTPGSAQVNTTANPAAAYIVSDQSGAVTSPPDHSAAAVPVTSEPAPAAAAEVSGQPVSSDTAP